MTGKVHLCRNIAAMNEVFIDRQKRTITHVHVTQKTKLLI